MKGHEFKTIVFRAGVSTDEDPYEINVKSCIRCGHYEMVEEPEEEIIDLGDAK